MDRELLDQAIEGAAFCGGGRDGRVVATDREVDRLRGQLRRVLEDLPGDASVQELRELLEPDAGEPDPET